MKDFFISYTGADLPWARWIAWELEAAGYTTILQDWDFQPGANFILEMDRATRETERTVALLSPRYLEALYTQPEWAARLVGDPKGSERRLVPVRIEECKPPDCWRRWSTSTWSGWTRPTPVSDCATRSPTSFGDGASQGWRRPRRWAGAR